RSMPRVNAPWRHSPAVSPAPETGQRPERPPVRRRRRFWLVLLVLVLVAAGLATAYLMVEPAPPPAVEQPVHEEPPVVVLAPSEVERVEANDLQSFVRVTGTLAPLRQATLNAEMTAEIEEIAVRPGDPVSAGQELVVFDTSEAADQVSERESLLASA